jgi:hypothetical protein
VMNDELKGACLLFIFHRFAFILSPLSRGFTSS